MLSACRNGGRSGTRSPLRVRVRRRVVPAGRLPAMAKVAIIGAGSVEFTRNILTDLCSAPELHGTLELALHDIDEERLPAAQGAANQGGGGAGAGRTGH